jgi:tetratricopeptide (TPR) repeat protein/DNA-binding winged helix-turn-helix (wHTH) protein
MTPIEKQIYRFADLEVDAAQGCVKRSQNELHLRQQTFQVLLYLLERHERLVTKEELIAHIWKDTAVTNDALVQCIGEARKALGDDPRNPRFIKTIPKAGYRFISPVQTITLNGGSGMLGTEEITTIEFEYEEEQTDSAPAIQKVINVLPSPSVSKPRLGRQFMLGSTALVLLIIAIPSAIYLGRRNRTSQVTEGEISLPRIPGKQSVAVMYFDNQSRNAELDWLREGLADMLMTDLSRTRNFNVLGRQQLNALLERLDYKQGERVRLETAREVARHSYADSVVTGSFVKLGEKLRINVQLYDARTNELQAADSLTVDQPEQILAEIDLLALRLSARLGRATEQQPRNGLTTAMTNNLEAYRYYSLAVEQANALHNTEAIKLLRKAIALDPQFAMAYARIGYAYTVTSNFGDKAKPFLEQAFQLSSRLTEKDRLYITAWYAIANLDYSKAIEAFKQLIDQYPLEVEAYERLARLLGGEGRLDEAFEVLKRGLSVDPGAKDIYNVMGGTYLLLGKQSDAIAMHQHYVALAPNEPNAHDSLGISYQWGGHYEQALEEYRRALELNPRFEVAVVHLGNVYFQQGRYRDAIDQYRRYIEVAPDELARARGAEGLARIYMTRGATGPASAWAQKALAYEKHFVTTSFFLALAENDLSKAERLLTIWTTNWPYVSRGGRSPQRQSYYLQGSLALKSGRAADAIENFKQAVKQYPPTFELDPFEDCLANSYLELGRLDEAIAEYERILNLNPNYRLVHYHLAQAYERKGDVSRAYSEYDRFLQVWRDADADLPEIAVARNRLSALA